jgi:hypothetical protein
MVDLPYNPEEFLPADAPIEEQVTGTTAPIQNTGIGDFLTSLVNRPPAQPDPTDPYANLSKTQKRMLAFAAIGDAGMALQGKEGTGVQNILADFTKRADMKRKAAAVKAQQDAIQQMVGIGAGVGGFDLSTLDGIDAAISTLSSYAISNPSLASGIALNIKNLQDKKSELMSEQASIEQGEFLFPKITDAIDFINPNGMIDEKTGQPIINPNIATRIARGGSEWLQSQEYQEFKGNLNTIKNNYTFENMVKLKKQGVTFGALSENELKQVSELVGQLDPANPQGTLTTLNEIRGFINLDRERRGLPPLAQEASSGGPLTWDPENGWGG